MKRAISLLLALIMVVTLLPLSALAAETNEPEISVKSTYASPGSTVFVTADIKNNPGIISTKLTIAFDDALTLIGATAGDAFAALTMTPPKQLSTVGSISGSCNFAWFSSDIAEEDIKDGTILTLEFAVAEDAELNEDYNISITCEDGDVIDKNGDAIAIKTGTGSITIIDYMPGDVNQDGRINNKDVVMLSQYIVDGCQYDEAGYAVAINDAAADVNADGKINMQDVVLISRYIVDGCITDPEGYNVEFKVAHKACQHELTAVEAVAATCTEDGSIAYWHCTKCDKYYSDAECKSRIELENTVIPAKGHNIVVDPAVPATYDSEGCTEGSHCDRCGCVIVKPTPIPKLTKDEYSIIYHVSNNDTYLQEIGVNNPNPNAYTKQDGLKLKNLVVDGYVFEGWYDGQSDKANKVTAIPAGTTGEIDLYAHWSKEEYTIQFDSGNHDAIVTIPDKTYTVDKGATLTNPEWYGYRFVGWSDDNGAVLDTIPKGMTGNITLHANWCSDRNLAVPVKTLADPIIYEDLENDTVYFAYEIGSINNVPLCTIKDFGKLGALHVTETVTETTSTSKTDAEEIAKALSRATTKTTTWSLSEDWNETSDWNKTYLEEHGMDETVANATCRTSSGNISISGSAGGSTTTTNTHKDTQGNTFNVDGKFTHETTRKAGVDVSLPVKCVDLGLNASKETTNKFEIGVGYEHTWGSEDTKTTTNTSTWNTDKSMSLSSSCSSTETQSKTISSVISNTTHYGESYTKGGSQSESQAVETAQAENDEYTSSVTYNSASSKTTTKTYDNANAPEGYYRIIKTGTMHVFGIVAYNMAERAYFTYTYGIMDDKTGEMMDYSRTSHTFDDYETSILPFEVPGYVNDYVSAMMCETEGLVVNRRTGIIEGYNGTSKNVVIPQFTTRDNGDGTVQVVKIVGISSDAFAGKDITGIKMGKYITEIPDNAFENCASLKYVAGAGITKIGNYAFKGCTSLEDITITEDFTSLGTNAFEGVNKVTVTASTADVARAAANSGAKNITLNLSKLNDWLENTTFSLPSTTESFELLGGDNTYSGLRVVSDAKTTIINGVTFVDNTRMPLELSSENVVLNRVSINSPGIAMMLKADNTDLKLYDEVSIGSAGNNAIICKNLTPGLLDSSTASRLYVTGNILACAEKDSIPTTQISFTRGKIEYISNDEYAQLLDGTYELRFDANGGSAEESSRTVLGTDTVTSLPNASREHFTFAGWYTAKEGGNEVTIENYNEIVAAVSTPDLVENGLTLYAHWEAVPYSVAWSTGTGYTITVNRTSSPNANAATGALTSGAAVYYGDVLSITYKAATGYTLGTTGKTNITVSGNITSTDIFASAKANSYTYNVVYKSKNGTALGSTTVTKAFGTTNTITAPAKSGYNTPASQSVKWDSTSAKTITFTYTPGSVGTQSVKSGTWTSWNNGSSGLKYAVKVEYGTRTASSVQMRVVWTNTCFCNNYMYYGYTQTYTATIGGKSTGTVTIASNSTFASSQNNGASSTGTSGWLTVPVSATATSTSISLSWKDGDGVSGSWSGTVKVPTY